MRLQKCPECGSTEGVRLLVDITKTWNGEAWEAGDESESFECFDCDATDIEPVETNNKEEF